MDNFIYYVPTKVYFGKGEENNVGKYLNEYQPHKVLLHYGGSSAEKSGLLDRVRKSLKENDISFIELGGVRPNPELSLVREGIALCQKEGVLLHYDNKTQRLGHRAFRPCESFPIRYSLYTQIPRHPSQPSRPEAMH